MTIVNVATLKEKLSYYLALVKEGQEILVTSHRHQVARILPAAVPDVRVREPSRLVKDLRKLRGVKRRRSVSAVKFVAGATFDAYSTSKAHDRCIEAPLAGVSDGSRLSWPFHDLGVYLWYDSRASGFAGSSSDPQFTATPVFDGSGHGINRHRHYLLALGKTIRRSYQPINDPDLL